MITKINPVEKEQKELFKALSVTQQEIAHLSQSIQNSIREISKDESIVIEDVNDEISVMEYDFDQVIEKLVILRFKTKSLMESYINN